MSDIVALLLDDAMPAERLGALLRAARKRRGWNRARAASAAAITAKKLRAYERGEKAVPAEVCTRLAAIYGDDLTAHVPVRVGAKADSDWLVVGVYEQPLMTGTSEEILTSYVKLVQRLRRAKPGEPLPLRVADVTALASALNSNRADIEQRIADVLGCTIGEARALHAELLRRKVMLPVAGLAAGVAAFAGVAHAAQGPVGSGDPIPSPPPAAVVMADDAAPTTEVDAPAPTVAEPADDVEAEPAPAAPEIEAETDAPDEPEWAPEPEPEQTHATIPVAEQPADAALPIEPQPDPDDTPVSVLPGEEPIFIIGDGISESGDY